MKKIILAVISLCFLIGGVSFVNAKGNPREEIKKSIEEMDKLVQKYNKASEKKKPAIEKEIQKKVADNYDKQIKRMEERTAKLEERVTKMKQNLEKMKTEEEKTKRVEKITQEIISGKKPMFFNPPWEKDGKMGKHPAGMKGPKHHEMKGCDKKGGKDGKWKEHKAPEGDFHPEEI